MQKSVGRYLEESTGIVLLENLQAVLHHASGLTELHGAVGDLVTHHLKKRCTDQNNKMLKVGFTIIRLLRSASHANTRCYLLDHLWEGGKLDLDGCHNQSMEANWNSLNCHRLISLLFTFHNACSTSQLISDLSVFAQSTSGNMHLTRAVYMYDKQTFTFPKQENRLKASHEMSVNQRELITPLTNGRLEDLAS